MDQRRPAFSDPTPLHAADISVLVEPRSLYWARYTIGADGEFSERGPRWAGTRENAVLERAGVPGAAVPITYDSISARTAAAFLLGYVHHQGPGTPLPGPVTTTLLEPDASTVTGTTWRLGSGLQLHYNAPFGAVLTAGPTWTLTTDLAQRWARGLLTLAAVLDHAHAVAAHAILTDRAGNVPIPVVGAWLDAERVAAPIYRSLADEDYLRAVLLWHPLTEQEWRRLGRTAEMVFAEESASPARYGVAVPDLRVALLQAGILCRRCGCRLHGEVASTFGFCTGCRPEKSVDALATALAQGCPGDPDAAPASGIASRHAPGDHGTCTRCALPIPPGLRRHAQPPGPDHQYGASLIWTGPELSFDECEALGLDGTGPDGSRRFPYTMGMLGEDDRRRLAMFHMQDPPR